MSTVTTKRSAWAARAIWKREAHKADVKMFGKMGVKIQEGFLGWVPVFDTEEHAKAASLKRSDDGLQMPPVELPDANSTLFTESQAELEAARQ